MTDEEELAKQDPREILSDEEEIAKYFQREPSAPEEINPEELPF